MSHVLEQEGSIWTTSTVEELDDFNCGRTTLQSRQLSRRSSHGGAGGSWGGVKAGLQIGVFTGLSLQTRNHLELQRPPVDTGKLASKREWKCALTYWTTSWMKSDCKNQRQK
ncbi:uncharacterized protein LOC144213195 [Stigmatopora nigra]